MTIPSTSFPPLGALEGAERRRTLFLAGMLSRPELEPEHIRRVRGAVTSPDWKPIPRLILLHALEPLFCHHAAVLGVDPIRLMDWDDERFLPPRTGFREVALRHYRRRELLFEVLEALRAQGASRMMLIKGAALAPLYGSPALRDMNDFDLVVDPRDEPRVTRAFRGTGWRGGPGTWSHPTGLTADVQVPRPGVGAHVWRHREPHPRYGEEFGVCAPRPSDHIILTALHAAQHSGTRLWRDLCDLQLLIENGRRLDLAEQALEHAAPFKAAPAVAALFRMTNRWCAPIRRLPERAGRWTARDEVACKLHCEIYRKLAADRISNAAVELATTFALPLPLAAAGAVGIAARKAGLLFKLGRSSRRDRFFPRERDPVMGDLPAAGSLERQALKLRLLVWLARSGQGRRYWRILRMRRKIALKARPFEPMKPLASRQEGPQR